jgi:hypothetical protein
MPAWTACLNCRTAGRDGQGSMKRCLFVANFRGLALGERYGAFSYSKADLPNIIRYIHHQQEHHTRKTFLEEYLGLLKEFDIEYDDRFVFKPLGIDYIVPDGTY